MSKFDITVAMPVIPPRVNTEITNHAINSVAAQTQPPSGGISCALDVQKRGAADTRQRALDAVRTPWVAFLDDDDFFYPAHLEVLTNLARDTGADFVYSWFDGNNPFPMHRGRQFNHAEPHHTTMTVMVRTALAREVGFLLPDGPLHQDWMGEDWQFILRCSAVGAVFAGTGEITWHYRCHGGHTSGLPTRW